VLSPSLAQEIAGDTSAVIGLNVLITDGEGIVIGSGDSSRIGSFHEASVEVMHTKEPAEHNASQAQELRGVRPGVTLPLVMDGRAVGTVGITGTPAQVRRFGLVVKRQTEILLRESVLMRSRVLRERGADVRHIRGDGRIQADREIYETIGAGEKQGTLFELNEAPPWKSIPSVLRKKRQSSSSPF